MFRIIKSTLKDVNELPKFRNWVVMFKEGIKVTIVWLVYLVPSILIMLVFMVLHINSTLGIIESNPSNFSAIIILSSGIGGLLAILYLIIIIPIIAISIAHMANNNSKMSAAFKLTEILNKISTITWSKLIKWYIATVIVLLIIITTIAFILVPVGLLLQILLICLVIIPYFYIYAYRSAALIYNSYEKIGD